MAEDNKAWKFDAAQIKKLIKMTLDDVLGADSNGNQKEYNQNEVQTWANKSVEKILQHMQKEAERYKFVVTCTIMQRKGAGLHSTSSCLWDKSSDNCCSDKWENKTMYCIVSVFALKV